MRITYDGTNGEEIAKAFDVARKGRGNMSLRSRMDIEVNKEFAGPALSLNRVWVPEDNALDAEERRISVQVFEDSWRIPQGFSLETDTGEVFDSQGRAWAHEDLVEL